MALCPTLLADAFAEVERHDRRVDKAFFTKKDYDALRSKWGKDVFVDRRRKGETETILWEALVGIDERLKPGEFFLCYRKQPKGNTKPAYLLRRNQGKRFRRRFTEKKLLAQLTKERKLLEKGEATERKLLAGGERRSLASSR